MSLVGDVIMNFRELATDLPQVAAGIPFITSLVQTSVTGGGFVAGNVLFIEVTAVMDWGETTVSPEQTITITGGNNAVIVNASVYPGTRIFRVYYANGTASGTEFVFQAFPLTVSGAISVILTNALVQGQPPARNTAYLPDTDGAAVSATAAYRWLNQALAWAAGKNRGGIPAFSAVGTINAQPLYNMNGYWKKLDTAWYDGYPLYLARKNDVFRKAPVPGYAGAFLIHEASSRLIAEVWPQPSRTSCQTTLSSPMLATDTVANLTNAATWVLGFGKAQIGSEIVEYSAINGNQLQGLVRGLAGTVAAAQTTGTAVTELNLEVSGMMVPSTYTVGSSGSNLNLPPGWDEALTSYMMYRFRSAEQDDQSATRYLQEATQKMSDLGANRIIAGPRQIQANAGRGAETMAGLGSPFGGVIVP